MMALLNGCSKKACPLQVGVADNCTLTKEQCPYFTQDIDYHRVLKQIKVEVAMEIFEEIERTLDNYHSACCPIGEIETYSYYEGDLGEAIAELKKKYTDCR